MTVVAWIMLALYDGLLGLRGLKAVRTITCRLGARRVVSQRTPGDLVHCVDLAAAHYVHPVKCLQRSVVATWLLRLHGHPARTVIGYRPVPVESHAWVEIDDKVVNDLPHYKRRFAPLDAF